MRVSRSRRVGPTGKHSVFFCAKHQDMQPYVIVGRQIWVHDIHWVGGRTVPCTLEEQGECANCKPSGRGRPYGYLHVLLPDGKDWKFLGLPHGTVHSLQNGQPDDYNLRGRKLLVRRKGKGQTAELEAIVDPHFQFHGELPPEKDPTVFLKKLYGKVLHLTIVPKAG